MVSAPCLVGFFSCLDAGLSIQLVRGITWLDSFSVLTCQSVGALKEVSAPLIRFLLCSK
jgi:hypothetical protein